MADTAVPRMHGSTHAAGGTDPIPGGGTGGGIDFDQENAGGYLHISAADDVQVSADSVQVGANNSAALRGDDNVLIQTIQPDALVRIESPLGDISLSAWKDLKLELLPTADPGVTDAVWNDGGTLVMSGSTAGGGSVDISGKVDRDAVEAATARLVQVKLAAGDTQPAFRINGDGKQQWGPGGSTVPDTNLYRSAGVLKTDSPLHALNLTTSPGTAAEVAVWSDGHIYFGPASDTTVYRHGPGYLRTGGGFVTDGETYVGFITTTSRLWFGNAADTALWRQSAGVIGATFGGLGDRGIVYGAPDSGGTGFRMLRIPN